MPKDFLSYLLGFKPKHHPSKSIGFVLKVMCIKVFW
jgi:hypothetical protein